MNSVPHYTAIQGQYFYSVICVPVIAIPPSEQRQMVVRVNLSVCVRYVYSVASSQCVHFKGFSCTCRYLFCAAILFVHGIFKKVPWHLKAA